MSKLRDEKLLKKLGKHIAYVRKSNGFTQKQVANDVDVEISQISRLERGLHNSSITLIFKIAEVMNISVTDLIDIDNPDKKNH